MPTTTEIPIEIDDRCDCIFPAFGGEEGSDGAARKRRIEYDSDTDKTALSLNSEIRIYPNPSTGLFNLTGVEEGSNVRVYSIGGQEMFNMISRTSSTQISPVDLSDLPSGLYLMQITSPLGEVHSTKLQKN